MHTPTLLLTSLVLFSFSSLEGAHAQGRSSTGFIENQGQWPPNVAYAWSDGVTRAWITHDGIDLVHDEGGTPRIARHVWPKGGAAPTISGIHELPGRVNVFVGDAQRHRQDLRRFAEVERSGSIVDRASIEELRDTGRLDVDTRRPSPMTGTAALKDATLPGLEWSTLIGGSSDDSFAAIDVIASGTVVATGRTFSLDYPTTPGAFDGEHGGAGLFQADAAVISLAADGSAFGFITYLGGDVNDEPLDVRVTPSGEIVVTGWTASTDFPVTPGALAIDGFQNVFVTRLTADGAELVSSAIAGTARPEAVAMAPNGDIVVSGCAFFVPFPATPGAFQETLNGTSDACVMRIGASGENLVFATYLGGGFGEDAFAVQVADDGSIYVAGRTQSVDFPVTPGAFSTEPLDGYVAHLSADGTTMIACTFVETGVTRALDIDAKGDVYITGRAGFDVSATPGAFDDTYNGGASDGFVTKLDGSLSERLYTTFFGGGGTDGVDKIHVDASGVTTLFGNTRSSNLPTTVGSTQPNPGTFTSDRDAMIARLSPDGSSLWYASYLGGSDLEMPDIPVGAALYVGPEGEAIVGGPTRSDDFPITEGAPFTEVVGSLDAFLAKLTLLPEGVTSIGPSTPGADGPITQYVTASPTLGTIDFGFACSNAPRLTTGFLLVGTPVSGQPLEIAGAELFVDVVLPFVRFPLPSDDTGFTRLAVPIPADTSLLGTEVATQFFWPARAGAASNAFAIAIQG